uniref:Protein kinase domain-containing protein n=2 Tax=Lotharella globosa TaxID=91324 RepID=A0A7S4DPQ0_9EUKA|eukprot:CAMPEP_0167775128 /NCGR_PEP_ID=MMETSP0111_2-20121227/2385_1 /TAXON_ID=91324 /ORGANISM="Lotharella globosa, Strain CCCM811" /LENGTH=229 /DNA_ID=CAMNT_0007665005 /DNA_START=295 /DNA_END=984 /DNA_ORIENTATION=+
MAPESISHGIFNEKSDSWMAGVLLWEVFTAKRPFASMTPREAGEFVRAGGHVAIPDGLPHDVQALIKACFHHQPSKRASMEDVVVGLDRMLEERVAATRKRASIGGGGYGSLSSSSGHRLASMTMMPHGARRAMTTDSTLHPEEWATVFNADGGAAKPATSANKAARQLSRDPERGAVALKATNSAYSQQYVDSGNLLMPENQPGLGGPLLRQQSVQRGPKGMDNDLYV